LARVGGKKETKGIELIGATGPSEETPSLATETLGGRSRE